MNRPTDAQIHNSIHRTVRFALTPEAALDLARRLTSEAHRVIEAQKNNEQAYSYVGTQDHPETGALRIRIGNLEA